MKIIITENQIKTVVFQNAVDMAWQDFKSECPEKEFGNDYCDDSDFITKIEVVTAYKTKNILELGIIFYIDVVFDTLDIGEYFWELEQYLKKYLGKDNFKLKLLNVINTNTNRDW
jgi:hypothetical protein